MIGWGNIILKAILPAIIYCIIHPIVGRAVVMLTNNLASQIATVFLIEDKIGSWSHNFSIIAGVFGQSQ